MLTERQMYDLLEEHYQSRFGVRLADEWYVGPANVWKFERDSKIITLTCEPETGVVSEEIKERGRER